MIKDLIYTPNIITAKCFSCKETFKLYDIQKVNLDLCNLCNVNNKLTELTTIFNVIKKIVIFAEKENIKNNDRLIIDVSNLIEELQGE